MTLPKLFEPFNKVAEWERKIFPLAAQAIVGYPARRLAELGIGGVKSGIELVTGKKMPEGGYTPTGRIEQFFVGKDEIKPWYENATHNTRVVSELTGQRGRFTPSAIAMGSLVSSGAFALDLLPWGRGTRKLKEKALKASTKNLVGKRYSDVATGMLDTEDFVREIERVTTKAERELIPFIKEGINDNVLKILSPEAKKLLARNGGKIPKNLKGTADIVRKHYDEGYDVLKQFMDINYIGDYYNRLWDIPRTSRFWKERKLVSIAEGVKKGLKPKTTDVADLIRVYDNFKYKTIANREFSLGLKNLVDDAGKSLVMKADKAPMDWKIITHPTLQKNLGVRDVAVHPSIYKYVNAALDRPFSSEAIKAVQTINAFAKKAVLTFSLFHYVALTESAFGTGIGRKAVSLWNPAKVYRALKNGDTLVFQRMDLAKDGLQHGLQLGALSDVQKSTVRRFLTKIERNTQSVIGVRGITKKIRQTNDLWDTALWDYYHNSLKLYAYEHWLTQGVKKYPKRALGSIKKETAKFVNDSFGGQIWELLGVNKKYQQAAHLAFLSPDWTLSVLRQASAPFKEGLTGKMGRKFWLRSAFYFFTGANTVNYLNTKRVEGEGRFMWDNEKGNRLNIFLGYDDKGRRKYVRLGKQFREVVRYFTDPTEIIGAKVSPVGHQAIETLTSYSTTGFPTTWKQEEKEFWSSIPDRFKAASGKFVPFAFRENQFAFALPTKSGFTNYSATKAMEEAIEKNDEDELRIVFKQALENNLDARTLLSRAKGNIKRGKSVKDKKEANKVIEKLEKVSAEDRQSEVERMKESGTITIDIEEWIIKILQEKKKIQAQKEAFLGI